MKHGGFRMVTLKRHTFISISVPSKNGYFDVQTTAQPATQNNNTYRKQNSKYAFK